MNIDGKAIAKEIRAKVSAEVLNLLKDKGIKPRLAVVLVGDDPASRSYVANKEKYSAEVGIESFTHRIPSSIKESELISLVKSLNDDTSVHGILVQLPLPKHLSETNILNTIVPEKDVDGLHPLNLGKLLKGEEPLFVACTPSGIMELLLSTGVEIRGKEAVVLGRSNIVGKPTAILLLQKHATVTICHSRTQDLAGVCRRADILVAAVGQPRMVKGDWVKRGAVVIDVGTTKLEQGWAGDVDYDAVKGVAGYITPVPGGVGPMTIAMLLRNTVISAARSAGHRLTSLKP
jgi:methylenetetrahydrofolate dehydrogenase (NADP+)/methenyltetrahydrofolate cyclohydrolase